MSITTNSFPPMAAAVYEAPEPRRPSLARSESAKLFTVVWDENFNEIVHATAQSFKNYKGPSASHKQGH